jgi:hypothetical protein
VADLRIPTATRKSIAAWYAQTSSPVG